MSTRRATLAAYGAGRVVVLIADGAILGPEVEPATRITAAVHSSRADRRLPYLVQLRGGLWTCTCARPDCSHVAAVALVTGHPSSAAKEAACSKTKENDVAKSGRLLGAITTMFIRAWVVMLLIGAAHSHNAHVPPAGYWLTFFLVWAARIVLNQKDSVEDGLRSWSKL